MKRRTTLMVAAALMVPAIFAISNSAQAQEFDEPPCPIFSGTVPLEGFCIDVQTASPYPEDPCPSGFARIPFPGTGDTVFVCALLAEEPPGDGGADDRGGGQQGGGGGQQGGGGGQQGGGGGAPLEITQETEQEAESGDIDQSFEVTSTGDNSNQCAGVQGAANTGNSQNVTGLIQYASEGDDFDFEEVGSDITVSPESSTTCDQQVNQAASASG